MKKFDKSLSFYDEAINWIDLDDCVNFDADEIGTAVSIISDDTKQRLLDSAKLRQAQRDIVAVVKTPKQKVDA